MISALRHAASALALGGVVVFALSHAQPAQSQANFVQNGEAGFVISEIQYGLSNSSEETGACPNGRRPLNSASEASPESFATAFGIAPETLRPREGETQEQAFGRAFSEAMSGPNNVCMHPERIDDPLHRTVTGRNVPAYGIDLDGQNSTASGRPAAGTCAHDDFRGFNGERGIDNQFLRAVGCLNSFQPEGSSNTFTTGMLTGAWGILISLKGVDDIRNDDDVEVGFFANADPIQLSPSREPIAGATYAMDRDARFRATTRGRIRNGVLTTTPVDVRFHYDRNGMYLERTMRDARLRATLSQEGVLEGYLAGYSDVEELYDLQFGHRVALGSNGQPAPLMQRMGTAFGAAGTLGYSCNGVYHALVANADGHRDPATGRCTSISTQYRIRAIPAFVVDTPTSSVNQDLENVSTPQPY